MTDQETRRARAYLSRVGEPADLALWALVERRGPVEAAAAVRRGEVGLATDSAVQARRERISVDDDLDSAQRHGIRLLIPEDPEWPHFGLAGLHRAAARAVATGVSTQAPPPLALWVRGSSDTAALGARAVSIVGARAATDYGMHVAAELAYDLAGAGFAVVSGGAFGIDAGAHRAALAAGGATILVSAGGLDRPYPAAHGALYEQAARSGLLISESPPGSAPFRRRFLSRNRLIAAFGSGTVVVEAGRRSGSLNTAAYARHLGRPLMAVPGPVTSALSVGCHDLLRRDPTYDGEPARLVTCAADVLAEIGPLRAVEHRDGLDAVASGGDAAARLDAGEQSPLQAELDRLAPREGAVYDALRPRAWATEDELSVRSGVTVAAMRQSLAELEVRGLAESGPLGYRLARAAARASRRLSSGGAAPCGGVDVAAPS